MKILHRGVERGRKWAIVLGNCILFKFLESGEWEVTNEQQT